MAALAVALAGCSSAAHHAGRSGPAPDVPGSPDRAASAPAGSVSPSAPTTSTAAARPGSSRGIAGAGTTRPGTATPTRSAARVGTRSAGRPATPALPAGEPACGLFTVVTAAPLLADVASFSRTTDDPGVCAYTGNDARTVASLGDTALPPGRTAAAELAAQSAQARSGGYRASAVTVAGRWPGVLEDGRPYVAELVWIQRGRRLDLTVSPASAAAADRVRRAAGEVAARFG